MKVAVVHDWLVGMRGGERVLEQILTLYPDAELFTLLHDKGACTPIIEDRPVHTSFVQRLPLAASRYRHYLPLFPLAIETFDFSRFDLVISSSHCVAKGIRVPDRARHVCYIHTPMRYVWDQFDEYFGPGRAGLVTRAGAHLFAPYLRRWDKQTANRVDLYVANSHHVASRVKRHYGREAQVVHPPVDLSRFSPRPGGPRGDYFLMVSAFAPYKRVDLAIEAFQRMKLPLKVVGDGQDNGRLAKLAGGPVELLGPREGPEVAELYRDCRAFVFPGEEDFGITPLEAQASGRPVIAYGMGGALETVIGLRDGGQGPEDATGLFFSDQTVEGLCAAVQRYQQNATRFDAAAAVKNARRFSQERFCRELRACVEQVQGTKATRPQAQR